MAGSPDSAQHELGALAAEQAALRRVATLVACGAPADKVFAAVTEEAGRLLPVDFTSLGRYEPDDTMTVIVAWSRQESDPPVPQRWALGGTNTATLVRQTGRPVRM